MAVARHVIRCLFVAALMSVLTQVFAAPTATEFQSLTEPAILYDGPAVSAKPLYIIQRYTPVEVVVKLQGWIKVRDSSGSFAWVDKKFLSSRRTVQATQRAQVRSAPDVTAPLAFEVDKDVALELLEAAAPGWIKVKHRDGQSGYVKVTQVWGL